MLLLAYIPVAVQRGLTPLHWAAKYGYDEMAELLVENGADAEAMNDSGATTVDLAIENEHELCAAVLQDPVAGGCGNFVFMLRVHNSSRDTVVTPPRIVVKPAPRPCRVSRRRRGGWRTRTSSSPPSSATSPGPPSSSMGAPTCTFVTRPRATRRSISRQKSTTTRSLSFCCNEEQTLYRRTRYRRTFLWFTASQPPMKLALTRPSI